MKRREFMIKGALSTQVIAGIKAAEYISTKDVAAAQGGFVSDRPIVGTAGSNDPALPHPAQLDELLTYQQVRDVVWLALDRDTSDRNLPSIVQTDSWVVIKPNIVVIPVGGDHEPNGWFMVSDHREGTEHWGLVTDLRVVKAVAEYLVERIGPRRITIAEGGPWFTSGGKLKKEKFLDGWHCKWKAFDNLSYAEIVDELNRNQSTTTLDIVDLNEDEPVYTENYDPYNTGIGAFQFVPPKDPDGTSRTEPTRRKGIYLPKTILERDVLITCPVLKIHSGAGVTLCMKNFVGCIHAPAYIENPNNNLKIMIHQGNDYNLMRGIVDLASAINCEYAVAEGFWATEQSYMAQNGTNINHNVVVAGGDVVATEAVCMMMMGFNPLDSEVLRMCNIKRLGEWNPERINIAGQPIKYLSRNYVRQNDFYTSRGIRKWMMLGPVSSSIKDVKELNPHLGERKSGGTWSILDGDTIIDNVLQLENTGIQDSLLYPLPGSADCRKNKLFYLALRAKLSAREDLCGQLLVGLDGGEFKAFLNGSEIRYNRSSLTYDPSPMGFLRFREGENILMLEIKKTNRKSEPVRFAANICSDFNGNRIAGLEYDPQSE